jgi:hypothetical protein
MLGFAMDDILQLSLKTMRSVVDGGPVTERITQVVGRASGGEEALPGPFTRRSAATKSDE